MHKDPKRFLYDIVEAIYYIFEDHLAEIDNLNVFEADRTVQKAVERELMTIGEAANMFQQQSIRLDYGDQVINRRITIVHQYEEYSPRKIWTSLWDELPDMKTEADRLLAE